MIVQRLFFGVRTRHASVAGPCGWRLFSSLLSCQITMMMMSSAVGDVPCLVMKQAHVASRSMNSEHLRQWQPSATQYRRRGRGRTGNHEAATGMVSKDQDLDGWTGTPSEPLPSLLNLLLCSDPGIDMDIVWTLHSDLQRPSSRPVSPTAHPSASVHPCLPLIPSPVVPTGDTHTSLPWYQQHTAQRPR